MAEKWAKKRYAETAKILRKLGYEITYKSNDRSTFRQRGIIRRLYEAKKSFINFAEVNRRGKRRESFGIEYQFKFQKLTPSKLKLAKQSGLISKEQFTKGGIFIEKPVNVPARDYLVKFTGKGVKISGGKRKDTIVKLNPKILAVDPTKAVEVAMAKRRKPKFVSLMVNGFNSRHMSASLKQFYYYLNNVLLPSFTEKNSDDETEDDEIIEKFTDIFHLKLIY